MDTSNGENPPRATFAITNLNYLFWNSYRNVPLTSTYSAFRLQKYVNYFKIYRYFVIFYIFGQQKTQKSAVVCFPNNGTAIMFK